MGPRPDSPVFRCAIVGWNALTLDIIRPEKTSPHNLRVQFSDGSRGGYATNAIGLALITSPVWRECRAWYRSPSNASNLLERFQSPSL